MSTQRTQESVVCNLPRRLLLAMPDLSSSALPLEKRMDDSTKVTEEDLSLLRQLLGDVTDAAKTVKDSVIGWRERFAQTSELQYPSGISLLTLKNHLLLSYLHHLTSLISLKLNGKSLVEEGSLVVAGLVKLRVVLEKIGPLEGKLKYQIEKLVRKADEFANGIGGDEEDLLNDPLSFRPNPANFVTDRNTSHDDQDAQDGFDREEGTSRSGIYRPPRIAAMPYMEGPAKNGKKVKKVLPSHMISDMSATLSGSTPYGESTSGLSVTVDPSLSSGTARHLKQIEDYEMENFTRMRMSKKDSKKRRNEEEEVAFGGLGAGKGGKRRLGGFGAEFDDLLGDMGGTRATGAYTQMKGMKKVKGMVGPREKDESAGTSGLAGLKPASDGKRRKKKTSFDNAVSRSSKKQKK